MLYTVTSTFTLGERVYTLTSCYAQATYVFYCPTAELLSDSEYAIHNSIASVQYQYYKYIEFFSVNFSSRDDKYFFYRSHGHIVNSKLPHKIHVIVNLSLKSLI